MVVSPTEVMPTLRALLSREGLSLSLVGSETELPHGALDRAVRWVHSTDLADPTPFLADELLLLTTGTQFATGSRKEAKDYVRRITSRGVVALGFGTEVVRDGVPEALADACAAAGLPLFEVPYRTPFIAVARANAEAVAAQAYARRSWALAAQRAISLAALRPDGLGATVAELARQLGAWVGLYDAAGSLTRESPAGALAPAALSELDGEVAAVLRRGARASSALTLSEQPVTLQTLGRGGHLRGVIAVASNELDQESRGVLTSVVAMSGLALEQHQSLSRSRAAFRAGLVEALRSGHSAFVRRVARTAGVRLPAGSVVVSVTEALESVTDWLELVATESPGSLFFGESDGDLIVVVSAASVSRLTELADRFDVRVGHSSSATYDEFADALQQARVARDKSSAAVAGFADIQASGVLGTLTEESKLVADGVLAPLRHAGPHLLETVRAYLEHNGSAEATANALSVHRHTVRARIRSAEQALGVHLDSFPARAELWAAFIATDTP